RFSRDWSSDVCSSDLAGVDQVDFTWMAWTLPTALFFAAIVALLVLMGVIDRLVPGNEPRVGVLGIATQRGDRLFLSLLGSAFIRSEERRVGNALSCRS